MNLIAKYLEKDPENAEIQLPTFEHKPHALSDYAKTVHEVVCKQRGRNLYNVANERRLLIRSS